MKKATLLRNGLIRMGNTQIYVSVFSFLSALFVIMSDASVYTLILLLSAVLHEAGHLFALFLCKQKPQKICIYPFGADMRCCLSRLSYKQELFVLLSGAGTNIIALSVSLIICIFAYSRISLFVLFCNAFLGVSNLIPISGLDGGRALYVLLCMNFSEEKACTVSKRISDASYGVMCIGFLLVILFTKANFSMLIMLVFFTMGAVLASHILK